MPCCVLREHISGLSVRLCSCKQPPMSEIGVSEGEGAGMPRTCRVISHTCRAFTRVRLQDLPARSSDLMVEMVWKG